MNHEYPYSQGHRQRAARVETRHRTGGCNTQHSQRIERIAHAIPAIDLGPGLCRDFRRVLVPLVGVSMRDQDGVDLAERVKALACVRVPGIDDDNLAA